MDWKIFAATFGAIFLAELADKTQLVGMTMSAKSGKPFTVFIASVCAYALITLISVCIGVLLNKYLKPEIIKYIAGACFVIIGILMISGKV
jgi:putative Ca2+/H+ antiporter (TMEM165/GDT1 family)